MLYQTDFENVFDRVKKIIAPYISFAAYFFNFAEKIAEYMVKYRFTFFLLRHMKIGKNVGVGKLLIAFGIALGADLILNAMKFKRSDDENKDKVEVQNTLNIEMLKRYGTISRGFGDEISGM